MTRMLESNQWMTIRENLHEKQKVDGILTGGLTVNEVLVGARSRTGTQGFSAHYDSQIWQ